MSNNGSQYHAYKLLNKLKLSNNDIMKKTKQLKEKYVTVSDACKNFLEKVPDKIPSTTEMKSQLTNYVPLGRVKSLKNCIIEPSFNKDNSHITSSKWITAILQERKVKLLLISYEEGVQVYQYRDGSFYLYFSSGFEYQVKLSHIFTYRNQLFLLIVATDATSDTIHILQLPEGKHIYESSSVGIVTDVCSNSSYLLVSGTQTHLLKFGLADDVFTLDQVINDELKSLGAASICHLTEQSLIYSVKSSCKVSKVLYREIGNKYSYDFGAEEKLKYYTLESAKQINNGMKYLYSKYKQHSNTKQDSCSCNKGSLEYFPFIETKPKEQDCQKTNQPFEQELRMYDMNANTSSCLENLPVKVRKAEAIECLATDRSGTLLAIAVKGVTAVYIYDIYRETVLYSFFRGSTSRPVTSIAFSELADYVSVTTKGGTIHLFTMSRNGGFVGSYTHPVAHEGKVLKMNEWVHSAPESLHERDIVRLRPVGRIFNSIQIPEQRDEDSELKREGVSSVEWSSQEDSDTFLSNRSLFKGVTLKGFYEQGKVFQLVVCFDGNILLVFNTLFQRIRAHVLLPSLSSSREYLYLQAKKYRTWDIDSRKIVYFSGKLSVFEKERRVAISQHELLSLNIKVEVVKVEKQSDALLNLLLAEA